ncbi:MAG: alpha/beta fold hydrolase [Bacteroidia bacterium]|nr:alpha/beta fold hydrolase [Bacteroidia bacterium]
MAVKLFHKVYPSSNSTEYLFILHGLFGMLDNWHNIARKLSEHINVVTVDQRNHGKSPHTDAMSFELMAEDLALLMSDLGIEKASILGHSMGGKTAMKFADLHPDKLNKLIIVDIAPKKYRPGHIIYFEAFKSIDFSKCESRKDADQALTKVESNFSIRQFLLKNLEKADRGYKLKLNISSIEAFYPKMIDELDFHWLINLPTLFIDGAKSGYISDSDKLEIEEVFTDVSFESIADAGHWVHAEQPEAFFNATLAFLQ